MDNFIETITSLIPLAIFALGVVLWIFIIRWERKMNWYIDNTITIEDIPAMKLRHVSDDPTLNASGYKFQFIEDDVPEMKIHHVSVDPTLNAFGYGLQLIEDDVPWNNEMDRKEFGEDDPSWNSITQMYDETR